MSEPVRPWTVLAEKNFALFWASLLVSSIGSQLTTVAVAWQVYEMTDSAAQLGLTGLFRAVPLIAFAFTGGWLADRVEPRRLLIAAQALGLVLSLALGFLTDAGRVQVWHIYAILFAESALMSFDNPTRYALIPSLVKPAQLTTGFALSVTLRQTAFLAGPFIAGAIIAFGGVVWCYYLDAASFLAAIVCLRLLKIRVAPAPSRERGLKSMMQGLAFILKNPIVLALLVMDASVNFFGAYRGLMPIFARDILGVGPTGLGALLGAPAFGALAGSGVAMMMGDPKRKTRLIVAVTLLYAAALVAFALSGSFMLSLAICFALGVLRPRAARRRRGDAAHDGHPARHARRAPRPRPGGGLRLPHRRAVPRPGRGRPRRGASRRARRGRARRRGRDRDRRGDGAHGLPRGRGLFLTPPALSFSPQP